MKILALDQSTTSSGYSFFNDETLIISGVFLPKQSDKDAFERIWSMYKQIRKIIKDEKPDVVVFEDIGMNDLGRNIAVLKQLARLQGCLIALCYECNVYFKIIYPSTWRSALGFLEGKPKKECTREKMKQCAIDYVNKKFNMNLTKKQDDLAESICIGVAHYKIENSAMKG